MGWHDGIWMTPDDYYAAYVKNFGYVSREDYDKYGGPGPASAQPGYQSDLAGMGDPGLSQPLNQSAEEALGYTLPSTTIYGNNAALSQPGYNLDVAGMGSPGGAEGAAAAWGLGGTSPTPPGGGLSTPTGGSSTLTGTSGGGSMPLYNPIPLDQQAGATPGTQMPAPISASGLSSISPINLGETAYYPSVTTTEKTREGPMPTIPGMPIYNVPTASPVPTMGKTELPGMPGKDFRSIAASQQRLMGPGVRGAETGLERTLSSIRGLDLPQQRQLTREALGSYGQTISGVAGEAGRTAEATELSERTMDLNRLLKGYEGSMHEKATDLKSALTGWETQYKGQLSAAEQTYAGEVKSMLAAYEGAMNAWINSGKTTTTIRRGEGEPLNLLKPVQTVGSGGYQYQNTGYNLY